MKHFFHWTTILLCAAMAVAQESYSTWGQHKYVALDTRSSAANVTGTVLGIPILIRLNSANFNTGFAQSVGRGADLRFTKAGDAIRVPHQIERWDSAGKKAEIWVLVDTVKGASLNLLRMHWAKAGVTDSSSGAAVFSAAQGYQAVLHMNAAGAGNEQDATANAFTAIATGAPGNLEGVIGRARILNNPSNGNTGSGEYFILQNSASGSLNFPSMGTYTLSAWFNSSDNGENGKVILGKGDNDYALQLNHNSDLECVEFQGGTGWHHMAVYAPDPGTWRHVTFVRDGVAMFLYIDGTLMANTPVLATSSASRNENFSVSVGTRLLGSAPNGSGNNRGWVGALDEVRLQNRFRSAAHVMLEYQNQRTAQTLVSLSDTPPSSLAGANPAPTPRLSARPLGDGFLFEIRGPGGGGAAGARLSLLDAQGRTVWSQTVGAADGRMIWDGRIRGRKAGAGVYVLRAELPGDGRGPAQALERRIPVTGSP